MYKYISMELTLEHMGNTVLQLTKNIALPVNQPVGTQGGPHKFWMALH